MEKKAKRFIRLLAKRLATHAEGETESKKVNGHEDSDVVKQTFRKALDDLPRSALKTELQNNAATYFRKLQALSQNGREASHHGDIVDANSEDQIDEEGSGSQSHQVTQSAETGRTKTYGWKTSKKPRQKLSNAETINSSDSRAKIEESTDAVTVKRQQASQRVQRNTTGEDQAECQASNKGVQFAYNVYATDAKSRVVDSLSRLSIEEKRRLAPHAYASLSSASSYVEFLQSLQPKDEQAETSDVFDLLKQEIVSCLGIPDVKLLIRCMADTLSASIMGADRMLDSKNADKLKELQSFILSFLFWAKVRHEALSIEQDQQAPAVTNFDDLLAAILSIYVDISIFLSRATPESAEVDGRHTLSKVLLLIGHSPHQLNLLLQVTQPTAQDCQFLLPIYKHMLGRKPVAMTNEIFVKYICAVRFSRDILQQQMPQVMQDIANVAMTAEPSKDFFQWLFGISLDAYSSLPDPVKIRKMPLVKHLMEEAPKDYLEKLLDIVSDEENDSQTISHEDSQGDRGMPQRSKSPDVGVEEEPEPQGQLFFTDTSRDEDLARQADSDSDSSGVEHSRLDALLEDIDPEEFDDVEDSDDEDLMKVAKPASDMSQGKIGSGKYLSPGPLTPQDSDDQSDHREMDMDTSAASEPDVPESLSFEEVRHNSMKKKALGEERDLGDSARDARDDAKTSTDESGRRRSQKALSPGLKAKGHVRAVCEPRRVLYETDSDRESFTTAQDNLDSTKDSVVIDVDDEVTFKVRSYRQVGDDLVEVLEDEDEEEMDDEQEGESGDEDDDEVVEAVDDEVVHEDLPPVVQPFKQSPTKKTGSPSKESKAAIDPAAAKKQKPASEEASGKTQRVSIRSAGAGQNQSSLLNFFSPVRKEGEESSNGIQQALQAKQPLHSGSDNVDVVPDSCSSSDEERSRDPKANKDKRVTPRRAKKLESLEGSCESTKQASSEQSSAQPSQKQATTASGKKRLRKLSRSARKISSSSDSDILLSPVIKGPQKESGFGKSSQQTRSTLEDVVSEGIKRIRKECVTSPEDLQEPRLTRSASKPKSSKRKSLTITGGVKSKTVPAATPKLPSKQARSATATPSDKAITESAKKRQGVSPLSPSKVKRVATFGDTYRMLAGNSQTDPGSLSASQTQSQLATPKRVRLQPKDLGAAFSEATPGSQGCNTKKQTADVQPLSASSQESTNSGKSSSAKKLAKKPVSLETFYTKTPSRAGIRSSQDSIGASQTKKSKMAKAKKGQDADADASNRQDDATPSKTALKRRASLQVSKSTKTNAKMSRKSTGGKT